MKKIIIAVLVIVFMILGIFFVIDNRKGVDQTYLLPQDFEGCAVIFYDVAEALPLEIVDNEIIYEVPEEGILYTSSPMDFGWVSKKQSGAFQLVAFHVDKAGKIINQLPEEEILFGANGSMQDDKGTQDFYYQIFGSAKTLEKGCPAVGA